MMLLRIKITGLLLVFLTLILTVQVFAQVKVRGYYRKDGTYVQPHYRSNPDGNPSNNWSYPGNTNPYTGKKATGNPDTYLRNYYNRSGSLSNSSDLSSNNNLSEYSYSTYYVTSNSLNVRSGPSTSYAVIGAISYANSVKVIGNSSNGWEKIEYTYNDSYSHKPKTKVGYVSASYLSRSHPKLNYSRSNPAFPVVTYSNSKFWDNLDMSGDAYQYDIEEKWSVRIYKTQTDDYKIAYTSLNCGGTLELISSADAQMVFKEVLTYGKGSCTNGGTIVLTKAGDLGGVFFKYYWPDRRTLAAEGMLD